MSRTGQQSAGMRARVSIQALPRRQQLPPRTWFLLLFPCQMTHEQIQRIDLVRSNLRTRLHLAGGKRQFDQWLAPSAGGARMIVPLRLGGRQDDIEEQARRHRGLLILAGQQHFYSVKSRCPGNDFYFENGSSLGLRSGINLGPARVEGRNCTGHSYGQKRNHFPRAELPCLE